MSEVHQILTDGEEMKKRVALLCVTADVKMTH